MKIIDQNPATPLRKISPEILPRISVDVARLPTSHQMKHLTPSIGHSRSRIRSQLRVAKLSRTGSADTSTSEAAEVSPLLLVIDLILQTRAASEVVTTTFGSPQSKHAEGVSPLDSWESSPRITVPQIVCPVSLVFFSNDGRTTLFAHVMLGKFVPIEVVAHDDGSPCTLAWKSRLHKP